MSGTMQGRRRAKAVSAVALGLVAATLVAGTASAKDRGRQSDRPKHDDAVIAAATPKRDSATPKPANASPKAKKAKPARPSAKAKTRTPRPATDAAFPPPPTKYRPPITPQHLADPGVIYDGHQWVVLSTSKAGSGSIATAPKPSGPYKNVSGPLVKKAPKWMNTAQLLWAPSIVRASDGTYVIFFSVMTKAGGRCIGTAHGSHSTGPFTANSRALACTSKSKANAYDTIHSEGPNFGLIDPTPAQFGSTMVLTYKTQFNTTPGRAQPVWHTTTRIVRLDPAHPDHALTIPGTKTTSKAITSSTSTNIEENPVLVQHGGKYTLFTSWGLFGTCKYITRYRQNADLWTGWQRAPAKDPTALSFPSNTTCGRGNAQVVAGTSSGEWRIFFNGHAKSDPPHGTGPKLLYVAEVVWSKSGRPTVSRFV